MFKYAIALLMMFSLAMISACPGADTGTDSPQAETDSDKKIKKSDVDKETENNDIDALKRIDKKVPADLSSHIEKVADGQETGDDDQVKKGYSDILWTIVKQPYLAGRRVLSDLSSVLFRTDQQPKTLSESIAMLKKINDENPQLNLGEKIEELEKAVETGDEDQVTISSRTIWNTIKDSGIALVGAAGASGALLAATSSLSYIYSWVFSAQEPASFLDWLLGYLG